MQDAHAYDWIVFTSPNGVTAFFDLFYKLYDDAREIGGVRIAAIGPATAQRVRDFHLKVDLQPEEFVAEASCASSKNRVEWKTCAFFSPGRKRRGICSLGSSRLWELLWTKVSPTALSPKHATIAARADGFWRKARI